MNKPKPNHLLHLATITYPSSAQQQSPTTRTQITATWTQILCPANHNNPKTKNWRKTHNQSMPIATTTKPRNHSKNNYMKMATLPPPCHQLAITTTTKLTTNNNHKKQPPRGKETLKFAKNHHHWLRKLPRNTKNCQKHTKRKNHFKPTIEEITLNPPHRLADLHKPPISKPTPPISKPKPSISKPMSPIWNPGRQKCLEKCHHHFKPTTPTR